MDPPFLSQRDRLLLGELTTHYTHGTHPSMQQISRLALEPELSERLCHLLRWSMGCPDHRVGLDKLQTLYEERFYTVQNPAVKYHQLHHSFKLFFHLENLAMMELICNEFVRAGMHPDCLHFFSFSMSPIIFRFMVEVVIPKTLPHYSKYRCYQEALLISLTQKTSEDYLYLRDSLSPIVRMGLYSFSAQQMQRLALNAHSWAIRELLKFHVCSEPDVWIISVMTASSGDRLEKLLRILAPLKEYSYLELFRILLFKSTDRCCFSMEMVYYLMGKLDRSDPAIMTELENLKPQAKRRGLILP